MRISYPSLMNLDMAAKYLGRSKKFLLVEIWHGQIRPRIKGDTILYSQLELDAWKRRHEAGERLSHEDEA